MFLKLLKKKKEKKKKDTSLGTFVFQIFKLGNIFKSYDQKVPKNAKRVVFWEKITFFHFFRQKKFFFFFLTFSQRNISLLLAIYNTSFVYNKNRK